MMMHKLKDKDKIPRHGNSMEVQVSNNSGLWTQFRLLRMSWLVRKWTLHSSPQKIQDGNSEELAIFPECNHTCRLERTISSHFFMILSTLLKVQVMIMQVSAFLSQEKILFKL